MATKRQFDDEDEDPNPRALDHLLGGEPVAKPYGAVDTSRAQIVSDPNQSALTQLLGDKMGGNTGAAGGQNPSVVSADSSPAAQSASAGANAAWDTDGFAAPSYTAQKFGGPMAGWDATKWADPNHQTPKYVAGRIFSNHIGDPAGAIAELQQAYPGTTFNGKDKVTIPGVGTIDFVQGASQGGTTFQWLDEANAGGGQPIDNGGVAVMNGGQGGSAVPEGILGDSTYQRLLKALQQGQQDPAQAALAQVLGGR